MRMNRKSALRRRWWAILWAGLAVLPAAAQDAPDRPDPGPVETAAAAAANESREDAAYRNMELLTQVMLHIRNHYYEEHTYEEITHGALHGLLKGLDPHSDFLDRETFKNMRDDTAGRFGGIGIQIGIRDRVLTVIAPIEDTPAFRAGLQAGDRMTKIDGESTMGMSLREAVERLRGEKGTPVTLSIRRSGEESEMELTIVRDEIAVSSVKGTRMVAPGIGYLRITQFAAPTTELVAEGIAELQADETPLEALVLDLRNNPGGLLRTAVEVADIFLPKKALIVSTRGREGVHDEVRYEATNEALIAMPLAVLVNGGSASASEIVAGALQDHNKAVLIGDATFGKGSVQSVIRLKPDGESAIRLTTALYYTPSGRQIHDKGIDPDIPVYVSPKEWREDQIKRQHVENPDLYSAEDIEEYAEVSDRALLRAVDLLRGLLVFDVP